jgi:hypothetical protein
MTLARADDDVIPGPGSDRGARRRDDDGRVVTLGRASDLAG